MSSALAIAAVTALLKDLLLNSAIDRDWAHSLGNVAVTALPPDRILNGGGEARNQLNLFMYQATPNQGWRNVELPSRDGNGHLINNPPLALDLHYLLTAFGAEEFHAEILLGYAMQLLHERPVFSRRDIRTALSTSGPELPPALRAIATSELAEQMEQVKIVPQSLSTEELFKLWAAFQTHYRPTAAYQVSVVLIKSQRSTKPALPVHDRNIYVMPFRQPVIEQVTAQSGEDHPIVAGGTLLIRGRRLLGDLTRVLINGIEVAPSTVSDTEISLAISSPPLPVDSLRAGVQGLQVVQFMRIGTPPAPHRGVESNVAPFVMHPVITVSVENFSPPEMVDGVVFRSADVNHHFTP
jgi:hypothetical protein